MKISRLHIVRIRVLRWTEFHQNRGIQRFPNLGHNLCENDKQTLHGLYLINYEIHPFILGIVIIYSFKNCVALLPWFRDCHVCYVTCSLGTDCHVESPAGRVQCFKVAKIDPVSPFYPTLWLNIAVELKFLSSRKPIPHFLIISIRRASLVPWNYLLVEEEEFFCSLKVSTFLPCGFVCEREESWC